MKARDFLSMAMMVLALGALTSTDLPAQQKSAEEIGRMEERVSEINEQNRLTSIINEGIFLYQRNDAAGALSRFQHARNEGFRSPQIHFFFGMSYALLGQLGQASYELRRYLELEPRGEFSDRAVDLLRRVQQQNPGAGNH